MVVNVPVGPIPPPPVAAPANPLIARLEAKLPPGGRLGFALAFASLAVAGLVGMTEVDKLVIASTIHGRTVNAAGIFGAFNFHVTSDMRIWSGIGSYIQRALVWHTAFDVAFMIGYTGLFLVAQLHLKMFRHSGLTWIFGLLAADVVEDIWSIITTWSIDFSRSQAIDAGFDHPTLVLIFVVLRSIKWLLAAVVIVAVVIGLAAHANQTWTPPGTMVPPIHLPKDKSSPPTWLQAVIIWLSARKLGPFSPGQPLAEWLRHVHREWAGLDLDGNLVVLMQDRSMVPIRRWQLWGIAWKMQRFSVVIVVLFAMLMIAPALDFLNQIPDIMRGWVLGAQWGDNLRVVVGAVVAVWVLWKSVVSLGRLRLERAEKAYGKSLFAPAQRNDGWVWVISAAVIGLVALITGPLHLAHIDVSAVLIGIAVLLIVPVASTLVSGVKDATIRYRPRYIEGAPVTVLTVGEALARTLVSLFFLGLLRSAAAPLIAGQSAGVGMWIMGTVGLLGVACAWLGLPNPSTPRPPDTLSKLYPAKFRVPAMGAGLALALALIVWPFGFSNFLGPIGVLVSGLIILCAGLLGITGLVQEYRPSRIFRIVNLKVTPAISLIFLVGILVPMFASTDTFHRARIGSASDADKKLWTSYTAAAAFADWRSRLDWDGCAIAVGTATSPIQVIPMVMIGAEGGGARAAWWTVKTMAALTGVEHNAKKCGAQSIMTASGASGGSIGLALMRASKDPVTEIPELVDSRPLGAVAAGLFVRDMVGGFTGILPGAIGADSSARYPDRAGLMEKAWVNAIPQLDEAFLAPTSRIDGTRSLAGTGEVGWRTVFNSTSALSGCKVMISDFETGPVSQAPDLSGSGCGLNGDPNPASSNLFATNPCYVGMPTITASLLSGRFGYVTPSGVVGGEDRCGPRDQLIDGGYAENSGIASLNDVSFQIMPLVRHFNLAAASAQSGTKRLIVPVVMSIENNPRRPETDTPSGRRLTETSVPLAGLQTKGSQLVQPDSLIEGFLETTDEWLPCPDDLTASCKNLKSGAAAAIPERAVVVAPQRRTQIAAPLGWVLSPASRDSLDSAAATVTCTATPADCKETFGRLLHAMQNGKPYGT